MANHVVTMRNSTRLANMRAHGAGQEDTMDAGHDFDDSEDVSVAAAASNPASSDHPSLAEELSQMSVISLGSTALDAEEQSTKMFRKNSHVPRPMVATLRRLECVADIDDCVDQDVAQSKVLHKLEQNWRTISNQFATVVEHLQDCSEEVAKASENCLGSLVESIESTCDKVDEEMKALYDLMSKCDELTTKLSMASNFREEIKTLRKSVETLEILFKNKPKPPLEVANARPTIATGSPRS